MAYEVVAQNKPGVRAPYPIMFASNNYFLTSDTKWSGNLWLISAQGGILPGTNSYNRKNYQGLYSSPNAIGSMTIISLYPLTSTQNASSVSSYWTGRYWLASVSATNETTLFSYDGLLWNSNTNNINYLGYSGSTAYPRFAVFNNMHYFTTQAYRNADTSVPLVYTGDFISMNGNPAPVTINGIPFGSATTLMAGAYLVNTTTLIVAWRGGTLPAYSNALPVYSYNGLTWNTCSILSSPTWSNTTLSNTDNVAIATSGLTWISAVGVNVNNMYHSHDGIVWRYIKTPTLGGTNPPSGFLRWVKWNGQYFIYTYVEGQSYFPLYYSSDGLIWNYVMVSNGLTQLRGIGTRNLNANTPITLGQPYTPANPNNWPSNYGLGTAPGYVSGPSGPATIGQALDIIANYLRKYSGSNTNFKSPWPV